MSHSVEKSRSLFAEAQHYIPGGVNSPVRAFKSVGGDPIFIRRAVGAYLEDADGNRYIDLINSWGPMILGHAHPEVEEAIAGVLKDSFSFGAPTEVEVEAAKLITGAIPSVEKVRMVNSGTEATMSAIRLARGYTDREKIIKFAGCYHGHGDSFLIAAGSGAVTFGVPDSPGVTRGTAQDSLIARFNDLEDVKRLFSENENQVAAVIIEPVTGNMGVIDPDAGFLEGLRAVCDEHGALLIYDEVMTGFRLSWAGAQGLKDIRPDITCLGKVIGGGMPVGAYGGRAEIMDYVSPQGPVYQAGTLSGNPLAMRAGLTTLSILRDHPEYYRRVDQTAAQLTSGLRDILNRKGVAHTIGEVGSMFTLFFREDPVRNFDDALDCDREEFARFFRHMLDRGIYFPPSQFEAVFISISIGDREINQILEATEAAF